MTEERVDPREIYNRVVHAEEAKVSHFRSELQRLVSTAPHPNEVPPRSTVMPLLEAEYQMAQERLSLLRRLPPRGGEWPAEWTIRLQELSRSQEGRLAELGRRLGVAIRHEHGPPPDMQSAAGGRETLQAEAAESARRQMAERHQREVEKRRRRESEERKRKEIEEKQSQAEEEARQRAATESNMATSTSSGAASSSSNVASGVRNSSAEDSSVVSRRERNAASPPQRTAGPPAVPAAPPAAAVPEATGTPNTDPILNLNLNIQGVDIGINIEPNRARQFLQQPPQEALFHSHAHPNVVRPHAAPSWFAYLDSFSWTGFSFHEDWSWGRMCFVVCAMLGVIDTALSYMVMVLCREQLSASTEEEAADIWRERDAAREDLYKSCIADPFASLDPIFLAGIFIAACLFLIPLRHRPEIAVTLIGAIVALKLEQRTAPERVSLFARGLLGLVSSVAGHSLPKELPQASLRIPVVFSLTQLVWTYVSLHRYYERVINKKWLRPRVDKYLSRHTKIVIGALSGVLLALLNSTAFFEDPMTRVRRVIQSLILLPSLGLLFAPMLTTLLEVLILAGPWVAGARCALTHEWMWWVIMAMQALSRVNIDPFALLIGKQRAMQELGSVVKKVEALAAASDDATASNIRYSAEHRVLPQEVLTKCREDLVNAAQTTFMFLFSSVAHSGFLWTIVPLASILAPLVVVYASVWPIVVFTLVVIPLHRILMLPFPQEYLSNIAESVYPLPYAARTVLGSAADGFAEPKRISVVATILRYLFRFTGGFAGLAVGRDQLVNYGQDSLMAQIQSEVSASPPGHHRPPQMRVERAEYSCLGTKGALKYLNSKVNVSSLQTKPQLRVPPMSPSEFLAHISSEGDPESLERARRGGNAQDDTMYRMPYQCRPIGALFSFLANKYTRTEELQAQGQGLDSDREAFVAMLQVLFTTLRTPRPELLMVHFDTDDFRSLVTHAIHLCGRALARPANPSPFGIGHTRRLLCCEWPSAQTDHEVMSQMLPSSGMIIQLAVYVLDNIALHACGVGVSCGPLDNEIEDFVEDMVAARRLTRSTAESLNAKRLSLATEWLRVQKRLHDTVMRSSDTLCSFVTFRETIYDGETGRALPPFVLRPDPKKPNTPFHVNVDVETITVSENTMLNMRGAAAHLLAVCLQWDGDRVLSSHTQDGSASSDGVGEIQHRFKRCIRSLAERGLLSGNEQAHPLQNMGRFTKSVLYATAKRRFLRVMTTSFYAGMIELLAVLLVPTPEEKKRLMREAADNKKSTAVMNSSAAESPDSSSSTSASLTAIPLSSPSSWLLNPQPNVRMYHRTCDAALMPVAPLPPSRLPFKLRPYDSSMRVQDLLLQLFDDEHWSIISTLSADPLARLGLGRGDDLAAAVLGMTLPPPKMPAGVQVPTSYVDSDKALLSPLRLLKVVLQSHTNNSNSTNTNSGSGVNPLIVDDSLLRHHIRSASVTAALGLVPRVWSSLQQRLLNQLTTSLFSTAVVPEAMLSESRSLQHTMVGYILRIEGIVKIATCVMESDPLGYGAVSDASRQTAFTTVALEIKSGLIQTAKHTNGLLSYKRKGNFTRGLSGIIDPYALLDETPVKLLFGLGLGPARAFVNIPNSDTQPMATRAVRIPRSEEDLLKDVQSELIFEGIYEHQQTVEAANNTANNNNMSTSTTTNNNNGSNTSGAIRAPTAAVLTRVPPVRLVGTSSSSTSASSTSYMTRAMFITPLDVHRWFLLACLMHPTHNASSFEMRVRRMLMSRRLLLGLDGLAAASALHASNDKGFSAVTSADGASDEDICTICLEQLDGRGRWSNDCLLTPAEHESLVAEGRNGRIYLPIGGRSCANPRQVYASRVPNRVREFSEYEVRDKEETRGAVPNPTMRTHCGHSFHLACLVGVLRNNHRGNAKCPMCRSDLSSESPLASVSSPPPESDAPRTDGVNGSHRIDGNVVANGELNIPIASLD